VAEAKLKPRFTRSNCIRRTACVVFGDGIKGTHIIESLENGKANGSRWFGPSIIMAREADPHSWLTGLSKDRNEQSFPSVGGRKRGEGLD
jgi:hypothetical protein